MLPSGRKMKKRSRKGLKEENMEDVFQLDYLPDDILYHILSFLDVKSLCTICRVSKLFKYFATKDCVWMPFWKNQKVQMIYKIPVDNDTGRISDCWSTKQRYKSSINWEKGIFFGPCMVSFQTKLMPWLQRDDQSNIWLSVKNDIRCYHLDKHGNPRELKERQLSGFKDDVSKFVIKDGLLVSGCRDGSLGCWNSDTSDLLFKYSNLHTSETHCIDYYNDIIVSGSRDKTVKVVSMYNECEENILRKSIYMGDRVWSLQISPCGGNLATGTAGNRGLPALTTWDLTTGEMLSTLDPDHKKGAGIINMKYEDRNTLLTCGYDTRLRMWDLRTDMCVASWIEPFDSTVFSFETDSNVSMVTGTSLYGMCRLWDKRTTRPIQKYYIDRNRSPVYSLTFDPGRLYAALDLAMESGEIDIKDVKVTILRVTQHHMSFILDSIVNDK